jgi:hypothetical protein
MVGIAMPGHRFAGLQPQAPDQRGPALEDDRLGQVDPFSATRPTLSPGRQRCSTFTATSVPAAASVTAACHLHRANHLLEVGMPPWNHCALPLTEAV